MSYTPTSLDLKSISNSLPNDLQDRIRRSRDPFILQKLAEKANGDPRALTSSMAKLVLDKSDDELNRNDLGEMFSERYGHLTK